MTLIVVNPNLMDSKTKLRDALNEGSMWLHEPSVMDQWTKAARELPVGFSDVCTRMPRRDKFIKITRTSEGWKVA